MPTKIDLNLPPKDKILLMLANQTDPGDYAWVDDFIARNYTFNRKPVSWDGNKGWLKGLHARYPDLRFSAAEILGEGQLVSVRWELAVPYYKGHDGKTYGPGKFRGTNIMRFDSDGRLAVNNQDDLSGKHHFFEDAHPEIAIDHIEVHAAATAV